MDRDYYLQRYEEELEAAALAVCAASREAHQRLARAYAEMVSHLGEPVAMTSAEGSDGANESAHIDAHEEVRPTIELQLLDSLIQHLVVKGVLTRNDALGDTIAPSSTSATD
ncbi:hypothetical protein [Sphingomonas mesophila]|uniref:hypothetical protein n=1 Tax=Sphingomonas mesophila TaxID=2303576 RepID=UPI000E5804E4|nr:hypothetical protein [Sphingomonas mesophila]